jgi:hypothetical protein
MKNKGYYGWIHSLNEAAMQSQQNGIDMLAEQAARKDEMLTEAKKPNRSEAGIAAKRAREAADTVRRRENREAARAAQAAVIAANAAAALEREAAGTPEELDGVDDASDFNFENFKDRAAIVKAEGMKIGSGVKRPETGSQLGRQQKSPQTLDPKLETVPRYPKYPVAELARQETARLAKLQDRTSKPRDVNNDGIVNANDVQLDAAGGIINGLALDAAPQTQVHPEPWYKSFGEADWAGAKLNGYQDKSAAQLEDEELRRLTMPESVSHKISKMMNEGKKAIRGRVAKGDDSDVPSRTPNREGAPKGIFRGTESPSEKVGRILEIVRDGPEKHGEEKHSWASSALETMQKQLRKD